MSSDTNGANKGSRSRQANQTSAEETNRYIVLFRDAEKGIKQLHTAAGLQAIEDSRDGGAVLSGTKTPSEEGYKLLWDINAAIVTADPDRIKAIEKRRAFSIVVPDCRMWPTTSYRPDQLEGYIKGYRDAVIHLTDMLAKKAEGLTIPLDTSNIERLQLPYTWGLDATNVLQSRYSGRGIKVAVLDTGFDELHPDFQGRHIVTTSFLSDGNPMDIQGHGTHCIGTAMGPKFPTQSGAQRYGCAYKAEIYAGKVIHGNGLDDNGEDGFAWLSVVLDGIEWAIKEKCRIINLSLGIRRNENSQHYNNYLQLFDEVSNEALHPAPQRNPGPGTLIVAATGNEGAEQAVLPAHCNSILAVGAVDPTLAEWQFSNKGADILAPGVDIVSSVPREMNRYAKKSGTSMATAHVSGIAAMWAEALEEQTGKPASAKDIRNALLTNAKDGVTKEGIVQAP